MWVKRKFAQLYKELGIILTVNGLKNHPEKINIDETGVSTENSPPKIVCAKDSSAQSVISPRTYNVTIIGGGRALGNHVPPHNVFPGKRLNLNFWKVQLQVRTVNYHQQDGQIQMCLLII